MAYDNIFSLLVIIGVVFFFPGRKSRRKSSRVTAAPVAYDEAVRLVKYRAMELRLDEARLAETVALSPVYPPDARNRFKLKLYLSRFIFVLFICLFSVIKPPASLSILIGFIVWVATDRSLKNEVTTVALANQKVYEAVLALGGWEYKYLNQFKAN